MIIPISLHTCGRFLNYSVLLLIKPSLNEIFQGPIFAFTPYFVLWLILIFCLNEAKRIRSEYIAFKKAQYFAAESAHYIKANIIKFKKYSRQTMYFI